MTSTVNTTRTASTLRLATAVGAVVTLGGYQSRVVDQCYRLPIVARMNDQALYTADSFVRAFDTFNPHWGYGWLLNSLSAIIGLSAALFGLYVATLALTLASLWRIRRAFAPALPPWSDWLVVAVFVLCRAGNIGTNHLWEDHLLDRQIGYALLWFALAEWLGGERRRAWSIPLAIGLTAIAHPGLGVLAAALWAGVFIAGLAIGETHKRETIRFIVILALAMVPWAVAYLPQSKVLAEGVDPAFFWSLATELQGPQHMRPVHWRESQWWAAFAILAAGLCGLALNRREFDRAAVIRASLWAVPIVFGLALATVLVEIAHSLPVAMAQPFRLATPLRGLCLILLIPHLTGLIRFGGVTGAARAGALILCLRGDRSFEAAVAVELALIGSSWIFCQFTNLERKPGYDLAALAIAGILASWWLIRNDTADGEVLLIGGYLTGAAFALIVPRIGPRIEMRFSSGPTGDRNARAWRICAYAWAIPLASAIAGTADPAGDSSICRTLAGRWRIQEIPTSDVERLAVAAREILPADALVLAPPRDKAFRHWSRRSVVVNVAGSPYQAKALADWAERLRIVAGEPADLADFARHWPENRVAWETHYEKAPATQLDAWATRFGATAIVTRDTLAEEDSLRSRGWGIAARQGSWSLWSTRSEVMARSGRTR
ncbi:hypothetical protein GC170_12235 [bacterium]|nr:hypothetical protein [bacterium]